MMRFTALFVTALLGTASVSQAQTGTLTVATAQDPQNWDPIDTFLIAWGTVAHNIYDGLIIRTPDLKLQPGLATKWTYLNGGKTLRFTLRKGVKFHNGEPFNANAVKFSFDRLLGAEGKKGPQQANYTSIKQVKVVDPYTVDFILAQSDPVLLTKLAGYGAMIVPPRYIKEKGAAYFDTHPVGTGPFQFVSYKNGESIRLQAFPGYWGGKPKVANLTFRFIEEPATRVAELQSGRVDIATAIPVAQAATVKGNSKLSLQAVPSPTVQALRFNVSHSLTKDVRVRRALNHAVDRDAIIKSILQGYASPIASLQSSKSYGYDPNLKPYPYDPAKAKALLAEAGVKPGTPIGIDFIGTDAVFREVAQAVAGFFQAAGLKPELKTYETNTFYSDIIPKNKTSNAYQMGWGGWTFDFDNTAYLLYHSKQFWNPDYSNKTLDAMLDKQHTMSDQKQRLVILRDIARFTHEQAIDIPLYNQQDLWGVSKRVQGFQAPSDSLLHLRTVSVK
ncbi:ABC transporter substrate-binding protein [Deinococcus deserti]|uniref:Putative dipeptide ABC transporter, periplasmic component n=1 Tax=Deinococcus deserti (strain DSM 17065 / CIP 109153 / LMG 22923 / VCD115) TaxID=546414 RepID=C1D3D3_DEIDV|nr:ABC transporter substrate-binding protein [Deinococcus deserti]ACO48012.1 putative dipeptide ABC transporter, periplasmic component [Deinococcus deserti VCD115]